MDYSIISYVALGMIIIAGIFITYGAFKFQEKNYPLEEGEKVLYEEDKVWVSDTAQNHTTLRKTLIRITDRRIYIFLNHPYLFIIFYFTTPPADKTKAQLKGLSYVKREDFKLEQDKKTGLPIVTVQSPSIVGLPIYYELKFQNAEKAFELIKGK